jgi:hypothetical protein
VPLRIVTGVQVRAMRPLDEATWPYLAPGKHHWVVRKVLR